MSLELTVWDMDKSQAPQSHFLGEVQFVFESYKKKTAVNYPYQQQNIIQYSVFLFKSLIPYYYGMLTFHINLS